MKLSMQEVKHEARLMLIALEFLTRVPVPERVGYEPGWLNQSARHFPLIGAFVGLVAAVVLVLAQRIWPLPVAVLLSMTATIVLTGAFHEDGYADTCDALGGAVDRDEALTIMKDSRLGSYAVVGLVLMLALKAAALWTLAAAGQAIYALVFAHAASRAAAVGLLFALPYAGDVDQSKAKPMTRALSKRGLAVAVAWSALAAAIGPIVDHRIDPIAVVCATFAGVGVMAWSAQRWQRRLDGYTGDTLGATQQYVELAIYLAWAAILPNA